MLIVPARKVEDSDRGITCLLGSKPEIDAPRHFLPSECMVNRVIAEGSDLVVLTLDESKLPEEIRKALGLR